MKCTTVQFTSFVNTRLFLLMFMPDATITSSEKRTHLRQKQKIHSYPIITHGRYQKEYVQVAITKCSHFIITNNSAVCMFHKYVSPKQ